MTAPSEVNADATTRPVIVACKRNFAIAEPPGARSPSTITGLKPGGVNGSRTIAPESDAASTEIDAWFARTVDVFVTVTRSS